MKTIREVLIVVGVFLAVFRLFHSYVGCDQRHRRILTDRAVASGAIVSSLFPSQARDKRYKEDCKLDDRNVLFGMRDYSSVNRNSEKVTSLSAYVWSTRPSCSRASKGLRNGVNQVFCWLQNVREYVEIQQLKQ